MAQAITYSTPSKPRAQTPLATHHLERKDNRPVVSSVSAAGPVGGAGGTVVSVGAGVADGRQRPGEGTLTAASLIDAIITHQISQSSDQRFPERPERPDRVDAAGVTGAPVRGPTPQEREEHAAALQGHTTSIKLGDLASNIITRDFCSPTTSIMHHNNRFAVQNSEGYGAGSGAGANDEWKRRDAPKHAPYLEPVSPPDNHPANRNNSNRRYSCVGGGGVGGAGGGGSSGGTSGASGGGGVLTAFDYVTNRIVEVMRSDADERTKPIAFSTTQYAYPYSALNVATNTADGGSTGSHGPTGPAPPPPPEPAPLMSAQYEPLSDED